MILMLSGCLVLNDCFIESYAVFSLSHDCPPISLMLTSRSLRVVLSFTMAVLIVVHVRAPLLRACALCCVYSSYLVSPLFLLLYC